MDARNKLNHIYESLQNTEDKSLFGVVSDIHLLSHPPEPLDTNEMHAASGNIIKEARREVLLVFYKLSFESDGGKEIYEALKNLKLKAEQDKSKIDVCILVNNRGMFAEVMYKHNNSIDLDELANSDYFHINLKLHSTSAFGSLHTKMIIIDSETAIIRGGDPDAMNNLSREMIETATLLKGPIVSILRKDFISAWVSYDNEMLVDFSMNDKISESSHMIKHDKDPHIPCLFLSKVENENPISPYYLYAQSPYKIALLQAISDAISCINIMTSNINDDDIIRALAKACIRGVTLNIITGKHHNDSTELWWGGTNFNSLATLVRSVPHKYHANLNIRWATNSENNIVYHGDKFSIHAKYICIDNQLVMTGSSPLDKQAMFYSREADIIFLHEPTAKLFDAKFFIDKFNLGRDYFEEAYFRIRNQIELQKIRIGNGADSAIKKEKCEGLTSALISINSDDICYREKLYRLIKSSLPILQKPTGYKPGMPCSYNTVIQYIAKYGLDSHFNIHTMQEEKEEVINHFFLIPSASSSHQSRMRSLSESSTSPDLVTFDPSCSTSDLRKSL